MQKLCKENFSTPIRFLCIGIQVEVLLIQYTNGPHLKSAFFKYLGYTNPFKFSYHTFFGGYTSLQSREGEDEAGTVVAETELEIVAFVVVLNTGVVEGGMVLDGGGVVVHRLFCSSTSQDALQ